MYDIMDIVKNVETVYDSDTAFTVLKDFERVLDELDMYVYANWQDGELVSGPEIDRHWVTCAFMWPRDKMPDPMGGKRLSEYNCKIGYSKTHIVEPRKIRKPDDIRPGTKKGKLDRRPIWIVEIQMPKKLIADIYGGYMDKKTEELEPTTSPNPTDVGQPADVAASAPPPPPPPAAPAPAADSGTPPPTTGGTV